MLLHLSNHAYNLSIMEQQHAIIALGERAKSLGLSMSEVCKRAGIAESTASRWRRGLIGGTLAKYSALAAVVDAEEAKRAARAA
jgi:transcriptional regulator with XRE-family HTH domain